MLYPFLIWALILIVIWIILYLLRKDLRKEMIISSLIALPFGLTEKLFVPNYWNPQTLFNLAARTGFDIESFIYAFAIGGVAAVLYEVLFSKKHNKSRRNFSMIRLIIALFIIFIVSLIYIKLNITQHLMHLSLVIMAVWVIVFIVIEPRTLKERVVGGLFFAVIHFAIILFLEIINPGFVAANWITNNLWGVYILKAPLEEIFWAFLFGAIWAPIYEDIKGYKLK